MLAKLALMVASKRDSICMAMVRAKYKVRHDWLYSDPPKSASPSWRAIEKVKQLIVKGACYIIGDGQSINVWSDPWVPQLQGFKPVPRNESQNQAPLTFSQLFDPTSNSWNSRLILELFDAASVQAIMSIPLPISPKSDKLIWTLDSKGSWLSQPIEFQLIKNLILVKPRYLGRSFGKQGSPRELNAHLEDW